MFLSEFYARCTRGFPNRVSNCHLGCRRLVLQLIFALLGLRNGLFLMFHTAHPGAGEEDLEEQLESASHLFLTGTFGIACILGPYYFNFLAWRALKFRMHKNYIFFYIIELLLVDILFGACTAVPCACVGVDST